MEAAQAAPATPLNPVLPERHEMAIMDLTGDTKVIWDMSRKKEVKHAEQTFNKLKKKGYLAYSVKKNGDKGEVLHTFDPKAEKIIMAPRVVGG